MSDKQLKDDFTQTRLIIEYLEQIDPGARRVSYYDVNSFYDAKKIKPAIKKLLASRRSKPADTNEMLTALQAHTKELLEYYKTVTSNERLQLKKEIYKQPDTSKTRELAAKYTRATGQRQVRANYGSLRQLIDGLQDDTADYKTVTDYEITDTKALADELLKSERLTIVMYGLDILDIDTAGANDNAQELFNLRSEADKLADRIGLSDSQHRKDIGYIWNIAFEGLLANILGAILDTKTKKAYYTPPNIRDDTDVKYVPKPPIEAINETLIKLASEPEAEQTIIQMYATEQDRRQKNGIPIYIDKFEQQGLFESLEGRGIRDINKILNITTGLTIPAFYMLSGHLQELQRNSGKQIEDLELPEMSIAEFMRINPRFNTEKARKKGIKADHKKATINSLDLLRRVQYPINQPIKKQGKTVGYELSSVKVYDYTLVTNENKEVTSIKGLRYSRDFLAKYNRILAIPYGDGFYLLTEITHQQLDITLQAMLTNKSNIARTAQGLPMIIEAKELKKIYKDYSLHNFFNTLANGLNKLAEVKEIAKWHTKANGQIISTSDKDSQILYIYPAKIHQALITSSERKVIKQEQARRLRDLKSLVTKYRNDLKANKSSNLQYLDYLAEDIKIKRNNLDEILAGDCPISDDLWQQITILHNEYAK